MCKIRSADPAIGRTETPHVVPHCIDRRDENLLPLSSVLKALPATGGPWRAAQSQQITAETCRPIWLVHQCGRAGPDPQPKDPQPPSLVDPQTPSLKTPAPQPDRPPAPQPDRPPADDPQTPSLKDPQPSLIDPPDPQLKTPSPA
ncbi:unnamed protein product [Boreogadus saida]